MAIKPYGAYDHIEDAYKTLLRLIGQGYHRNDLILMCAQCPKVSQGEKAHVQRALIENICRTICKQEDQAAFFKDLPQAPNCSSPVNALTTAPLFSLLVKRTPAPPIADKKSRSQACERLSLFLRGLCL